MGGHERREVSPCTTTTYTLDVQLKDGQHEYRDATIQVTGNCAGVAVPTDLFLDYHVAGTPLAAGLSTVISYTVSNPGLVRVDGLSLMFDPGLSPTQRITLESGLGLSPGDQLNAADPFAWPAAGTYHTRLEIGGSPVSKTLTVEVQ